MNKRELLARYGTAQLIKYRHTAMGEHEATIAAAFAVMDVEGAFQRRMRDCSEKDALAVLEMDAEDSERAACEAVAAFFARSEEERMALCAALRARGPQSPDQAAETIRRLQQTQSGCSEAEQ